MTRPREEISKKLATLIAFMTTMKLYAKTVKSFFNATVPIAIQRWIVTFLRSWFVSRMKLRHQSKKLHVIIEDRDLSGRRNSLFDDSVLFFGDKIHESGSKIRVSREPECSKLVHSLTYGDDEVYDEFQGARIDFRHCRYEKNDPEKVNGKEFIEMIVDKKDRHLVLDSYLPLIEEKAVEMRKNRNKILTLWNNNNLQRWEKSSLVHPSNFQNLALPLELKSRLIKDVDRFVGRKEYYKKVGRAWKRGYLLHGPPGTGKSSLVAAIANRLSFDINGLDSSLRKILKGVGNGSILVIEDIDCQNTKKLSTSGILNAIDGIWCASGEERIIIATTNHLELLDQALIRDGRMDMVVYMGYCSFEAFRTLAFTYLSISEHTLFPKIESLLSDEVVTPAQVTGVIMRSGDESGDVELALKNLIKFIEEEMIKKKLEKEKLEKEKLEKL